MIDKISFENYKLFKERQVLELKPLTILIGKNSSGKSSLTKLLPLIEKSLKGDIGLPVDLTNFDVKLGSEFRDLVYGRYPSGALSLSVASGSEQLDVQIASGAGIRDLPKVTHWKLNDEIELKYNDTNKKYIDQKNNKEYLLFFDGFNFSKNITEKEFPDSYFQTFNKCKKQFDLFVNYIGPYRFTSERTIESTIREINDGKLYIDGRKAYPYLVGDVLYKDGHILRQLNKWFEDHFEGWGLDLKIDNPPLYELELIRNVPDLRINFSDVGQGMIQSLPLILSSFLPLNGNAKNTINVFEQPELHLHPAVHGDLAERFAISTIDQNKKYLIETHSQNFVLRLRRLIAEGKLEKDNLAIYYVDFNKEKVESNLTRITVNSEGEVDFWPSKVFNESLEEVLAIRKAQKRITK